MKKHEKEVKRAKAPKDTTKNVAKGDKKPFVIFRPFIRFGAYIAASFRELRQMRFPNRKAAWKMTFAVVVYALIFFIFIALLDAFWGIVFRKILG
ncbi:MAG: preprotein translocase subunit SecE [Candidatus Nomurabacteria bacterium]|jgi:preprotein translocase SecE subunit|nr:preprotein translocase subunit SecE [Candidatus Nomurabacteria bacterium]